MDVLIIKPLILVQVKLMLKPDAVKF